MDEERIEEMNQTEALVQAVAERERLKMMIEELKAIADEKTLKQIQELEKRFKV